MPEYPGSNRYQTKDNGSPNTPQRLRMVLDRLLIYQPRDFIHNQLVIMAKGTPGAW
jgi:hypothetical protein